MCILLCNTQFTGDAGAGNLVSFMMSARPVPPVPPIPGAGILNPTASARLAECCGQRVPGLLKGTRSNGS